MKIARIVITMKPGVLDPQGKALTDALRTLDPEGVRDVRVGKYIEIALDDGDPEVLQRRVNEYCRRLLVNPATEEYRFTIDDAAGAVSPREGN